MGTKVKTSRSHSDEVGPDSTDVAVCYLTLFYPRASLSLLCNFAPGVKQHLRGRGEVYNYGNKMLALDFPCRSWAMTYFCFMVTAPGEPRGGFSPCGGGVGEGRSDCLPVKSTCHLHKKCLPGHSKCVSSSSG